MNWFERFLAGQALKRFEKEAMKMPTSWRTSLVGVLIIVGAVASQGVNLLDGDPATTVDLKVLGVALAAGWGFIQARDQKAHEEEKGGLK